eukprot:3126787-Alexandrium_andersonii.AAC.1
MQHDPDATCSTRCIWLKTHGVERAHSHSGTFMVAERGSPRCSGTVRTLGICRRTSCRPPRARGTAA